MAFWWCLEHKAVEEHLGCGSTTRLGPYPDAATAAGAIARQKKREAEQVEKDKADAKFWGKKPPD